MAKPAEPEDSEQQQNFFEVRPEFSMELRYYLRFQTRSIDKI